MRNLDSIFDGAERSTPNPFREDIFAPGITPLPGVDQIHGEALARCLRAFEGLLAPRTKGLAGAWAGLGRTLLLAAPRAGFGKSHLVGRIRAAIEELVAPLALPFDPARPVSWDTLLVSLLNQYRSARCPQHPSCSQFEETARHFQSLSVRQALERGLVDAKELPESEIALRVQFREVFDPKSGNRMVSWLTKRSPEIMDAVAGALGQRWGLEFDDVVFWNRFFQDATRPKSTAFEQFRTIDTAVARDRLTQFLRIASDCRPIAFIADHLDGFFGSETAGMRLAEILTDLRVSVPRSVTLLCVNEDVWNSVFEGRIPTAWIDRLTGEATALRELTPADAEDLLRARLLGAGWPAPEVEAWMIHHRESCVDSGTGSLYPREVLRRAAREWDRDPMVRPEAVPASRPPVHSGGEAAPPAPPSVHPLETVTSLFAEPAASRQPGASPAGNVFSAVNEAGPAGAAGALRPRPASPAPPAPRPGAEAAPPVPPEIPSRREKTRIDDPSAAARAAGIDPTRGLTNIEAIIAEIRGGGAKSISETTPPRQWDPVRPGIAAAPPPVPGGSGMPPSQALPARDLETRLRQCELAAAAAGGRHLEWQPRRLERLIRSVGQHFGAVGQQVETIENRPCLIWSVRGTPVRIGFESPEHFAYWSAVVDRARHSPILGKVVLFSHPAAPVARDALAAMGADPEAAARLVDVIEMTDAELSLVYGAEQFLAESEPSGLGDRAVRLVARRLDPFWRRLGQPKRGAGTAG